MSSFTASPASIASNDAPQTPGTAHDDGVLNTVASLSIEDEGPVEVQVTTSGTYKGHGRTGCFTPPFVRQGLQSRSDDVFNSPAKHKGSSPRSPTAPRKKEAMKGSWRSRSSSDSDPDTPSPSSGKNPTMRVQEHASEVHGSNLSGYRYVKAEDSQALYLPSCCVFVANLLQSEGDQSLEVAVTRAFREYGTVFVKIRRDHKHMPFAFCQYTEPEHAELAIKEGRGRLIKGRPCRCEKAKAHRLFFIERKYGPTITPEEAEELLASFGKLDTCRYISHVERTALNLNEGVIVQFVMYDEGQDANSAFRNHEQYKFQAVNGMGSSPRTGSGSRTSPSSDEDRAYLQRYDVDRRSIWVGHLPMDISETQLRQLFGHYGNIAQVFIRETLSKFEPFDKIKFAFIEFQSHGSVSQAINAMNGSNYGGKTLRVSQKDSEGAKNRAVRASSGFSTATSSYRSPAARFGQQPVSPPMTQMSSSGYGSPYGYPFGSPYFSGYSNATWVTDSQGQYYVVPSQSPYSYYAGSPAYNTGFSASGASGSPTSQQQFYGYYPYGVQYYTTQAPSLQQQPAPSFPLTGNTVAEDRSATPTPAGHSPVVSSSMESE